MHISVNVNLEMENKKQVKIIENINGIGTPGKRQNKKWSELLKGKETRNSEEMLKFL